MLKVTFYACGRTRSHGRHVSRPKMKAPSIGRCLMLIVSRHIRCVRDTVYYKHSHWELMVASKHCIGLSMDSLFRTSCGYVQMVLR